MTHAQDHIIGRIALEIETGQSTEAWELQNELSQLLQDRAMAAIALLFDQWVGADQVVRIDRLELKLPPLDPQHLDEFVPQLVTALEVALGDAPPREISDQRLSTASTGQPDQPEISTQTRPEADWESLLYFLEYGRLPWWQPPTSLLTWLTRWESVIQSAAPWREPLRRLLVSQPTARQRLVDQLPEPLPQQLVVQLQPAWGRWPDFLAVARQLMATQGLSTVTRQHLENQAWLRLLAELRPAAAEPWLTQTWLQGWLDEVLTAVDRQTPQILETAGNLNPAADTPDARRLTVAQRMRHWIGDRTVPNPSSWLAAIDAVAPGVDPSFRTDGEGDRTPSETPSAATTASSPPALENVRPLADLAESAREATIALPDSPASPSGDRSSASSAVEGDTTPPIESPTVDLSETEGAIAADSDLSQIQLAGSEPTGRSLDDVSQDRIADQSTPDLLDMPQSDPFDQLPHPRSQAGPLDADAVSGRDTPGDMTSEPTPDADPASLPNSRVDPSEIPAAETILGLTGEDYLETAAASTPTPADGPEPPADSLNDSPVIPEAEADLAQADRTTAETTAPETLPDAAEAKGWSSDDAPPESTTDPSSVDTPFSAQQAQGRSQTRPPETTAASVTDFFDGAISEAEATLGSPEDGSLGTDSPPEPPADRPESPAAGLTDSAVPPAVEVALEQPDRTAPGTAASDPAPDDIAASPTASGVDTPVMPTAETPSGAIDDESPETTIPEPLPANSVTDPAVASAPRPERDLNDRATPEAEATAPGDRAEPFSDSATEIDREETARVNPTAASDSPADIPPDLAADSLDLSTAEPSSGQTDSATPDPTFPSAAEATAPSPVVDSSAAQPPSAEEMTFPSSISPDGNSITPSGMASASEPMSTEPVIAPLSAEPTLPAGSEASPTATSPSSSPSLSSDSQTSSPPAPSEPSLTPSPPESAAAVGSSTESSDDGPASDLPIPEEEEVPASPAASSIAEPASAPSPPEMPEAEIATPPAESPGTEPTSDRASSPVQSTTPTADSAATAPLNPEDPTHPTEPSTPDSGGASELPAPASGDEDSAPTAESPPAANAEPDPASPAAALAHPLMARPPRQAQVPSLSRAELANGIYLNCAGLVLLHPFLRIYFDDVGLLAEDAFRHEYAQQMAMRLLHYLATGRTNAPEYELVLPKLLCGWPLNDPVSGELALPDAALAEGEHLLETVIHYWDVLKNTSPDGLREGFLQRQGRLTRTDMGDWKLRVEQQAIDILLSRLPWGVSMVKLPWMADVLVVEWA